MKCLYCKKEIKKNEKHYRIMLYDKGKQVAEDDVHYICWHKAFNPSTYLPQAMKCISPIISQLKNQINPDDKSHMVIK